MQTLLFLELGALPQSNVRLCYFHIALQTAISI